MQTMNVIEEVRKLDLPPREYLVLGSGILGALGIREIGDIDLLVTSQVFDKLRDAGWTYDEIEIEGKIREHLSKGDVEVYRDFWYGGNHSAPGELIASPQVIDGIPFLPIHKLAEIKRVLARPKDLRDLELIDSYLQNKSKVEHVINKIRSEHGTLFILCGYPYAGKSFIAQQIVTGTDIAYVSIDDIFHARGFDWNSNRLPNATAWEQIFDESYAKTRELLKIGKNVLYDSTSQTVVSRNKLRTVARSVGAEAYVVYVHTSVEKVWKRWEASIKSEDRHNVSKDLVEETIAMFEVPTEQENVLRVEN